MYVCMYNICVRYFMRCSVLVMISNAVIMHCECCLLHAMWNDLFWQKSGDESRQDLSESLAARGEARSDVCHASSD